MSAERHTSAGRESGTTLVELLVVLVILSILAVTAMPLAETAYQRRHELALRESLRDTRRAIDSFHADWEAGIIVNADTVASETGYPVTLDVLLAGTRIETDDGESERRYLRRLPENPFAEQDAEPDRQFWLMGYAQHETGVEWDGNEVYDLRPRTDRKGLDGTPISDW